MSVSDRLRTWFLRGMVKAASLPVPFVPEWQRVQFMSPTFKALCREGVRANSVVFSCLSVLTFAYPEPILRVYKDTGNGLEPLPNHPLQALLNRPNPQMGQAELLQYLMLYKAIGGNCYFYKVRSQARKVVEMLPLNDSQITPVAGGPLPVSHYLWHNETTGQDEVIPAEDIVHLKWMPDPLSPARGLSPLVAAAREVDTDNAARRYAFTLLKNDAIPRVVITAPPGMTPLNIDERTRLENLFADKYGGDNRGKAAILGGLDVKVLSLNLQEMAFEALGRVPEARISGNMRVPAILAGLNVGLDNATYANLAGLRKFFTETTLVPMWRMDADEIGSDLLPEFGNSDGLVVAFDTSNVMSLQEQVTDKRQWVDGAVTKGYMMVSEGRAALGLPHIEGTEVFLRSMVVQEVPVIVSASGKALLPSRTQTKAKEDRRKVMLALIAAQRQNRTEVAGRMETALDNYFGGLADRIIHRALTAEQPAKTVQRKGIQDGDLLFDADATELEELVKRFYVELLQLSWQNWNLELGIDAAFDLTDPAVTKALEGAGARVKAIHETTRGKLQEALQFANENGWSIDHLVRGDVALGRPGLRDLIEQTYKGRARTIARTELGTAQQIAAAQRYASANIDRVLVLDNGVEDSDPACQVLGNGGQGTIMSLAWAQANPLQHPNCLRAFGAAFPDDGPIDTEAHANWLAASGDSSVIGGS